MGTVKSGIQKIMDGEQPAIVGYTDPNTDNWVGDEIVIVNGVGVPRPEPEPEPESEPEPEPKKKKSGG